MKSTQKEILISPNHYPIEVELFFIQLGFKLIHNYNPADRNKYCFVVDDFSLEIDNIPRIRTNFSSKFDEKNEDATLLTFNTINLESPAVQRLVKRALTNQQNFISMIEFSKDFSELNIIKIHDSLNIGYFIDSIVTLAYKENFAQKKIRNFLNIFFEVTMEELEKRPHSFLEVIYSFSDEIFIIEASYDDNLFSAKKMGSEFQKILLSLTNFLHVDYFEKRSRSKVSSLWFKDYELTDFKASMQTRADKRENILETNVSMKLAIEINPASLLEVQSLSYAELQQNRNSFIAKKLSEFIIKQTKNSKFSENIEWPSSFSTEDIKRRLLSYPSIRTLNYINDDILNMIMVHLKADSPGPSPSPEVKGAQKDKTEILDKINRLKIDLEKKLASKE